MRFADRIALVTGGYRGMGGESARALAREGAIVIAADIIAGSPPDAEPGVIYRHLDVTSPEQWSDVVAAVIADHGRIDILVNAAGVTQERSEPHSTDLEEWERVIAVNQTGVMLGMKTVSAAMLGKADVSIVNISSIWGLVAGSGQLAYHASKGAVTLMTLNAAITYADRGIRVNAVLPGLIDTEMVRDQDPAMRAETIANTPMKRIGMPGEVARAILFLASDEASYITGALLPVDGGYTAR